MSEETTKLLQENVTTVPPKHEYHSLSQAKTPGVEGTVYCETCKKDVVRVMEWAWCGTERFAFCPNAPEVLNKNNDNESKTPKKKKAPKPRKRIFTTKKRHLKKK